MSRLRKALATLRADLWTTALDPLPRMGGPRALSRLPHAVVVLYATAMGLYPGGEGIDPTVPLLAMAMAAAMVLAMWRPVPAWWATIVLMVAGARAGMVYVANDLSFPWTVHPEAYEGLPFSQARPLAFPWTGSGVALQAGVLFLLALRVRPRVAVKALAITALTGVAIVALMPEANGGGLGVTALMADAVAVAVGAGVRQLRTTRTRLEAQEGLTAEERARRTLLEERSRIARELHDVVAHHMSVISIQAQVAPHLVNDPPQELRENLAGIRQNAVEALTELRRVLGVLRAQDQPGDAPQPTLDRLDELLANVRGAGVTLTAEIAGRARPLSPGVELSAYRIVQEALSNAMRHAPGAAVTVRLEYRPGSLAIRVVNGPPGRPARPSPGAGHGLLGMRERTAMLGGDLVAGPTPAGGYEVSVFLPVDQEKGIQATS
ncbi:sensor histidine kinase [Nonomuraea sp. NPDC049607]|uniref:sensor histidine kinase n=1 Tax=Nonomuraea sp. NPDC049607 TaxID=3154732 RepID=UPI00341452FE